MSFLNKKKVLIIGHSPKVLEKELGEKIDAFDGLIARCNWFEINGYDKNIGTRTDVLIAGAYRVNSEQANREYKLVLWLSGYEKESWSVCRIIADKTHKNIVSTMRKEFRELIRVLGLKWYPTTGMRGIYYFLKQGYKVYLHGFDFCVLKRDYYLNSTHEDLTGHHEPEKERDYVNKLIKTKKLFWFDKEKI